MTVPQKSWKTLKSRVVYENAWLRLREDDVVRPDGSEGIYGVVEIRPSVGIVALNGKNEIALVGQWRYPHDKYSWEIPRGGSLEGELELLAVAKRELKEEAGVVAENWTVLGEADICNGVTTDIQHFFLATGLSLTDTHHDPEEDIAVRWVPLERAIQMVMAGEISECCSIAAILKADKLLQDGHCRVEKN